MNRSIDQDDRTEIGIFPGDRVKLLRESATYGTVWSLPTGSTVAVRLDDGRAVRVDTKEIAHLR